jgi:allantoinase
VENEAADIARTTELIAGYAGRRPRGWLGLGLTETWEMPDLLLEAGYEYVCDWVLDDQPVLLKTCSGSSIVSVPYTQECNDVAMMLIQHHKASEYSECAIDQFEQLRHDAHGSARVMPIVLHPYIMAPSTASSISKR